MASGTMMIGSSVPSVIDILDTGIVDVVMAEAITVDSFEREEEVADASTVDARTVVTKLVDATILVDSTMVEPERMLNAIVDWMVEAIEAEVAEVIDSKTVVAILLKFDTVDSDLVDALGRDSVENLVVGSIIISVN